MSIQLWNEMKLMRKQVLELVQRIESLEDSRAELRKKRETLTLPSKDIPTLMKIGNAERREVFSNGSSERGSINGPK
jgi:prefoldin subunit 5